MFEQWLTRLQEMDFPTQIRESAFLFPSIETVHVFALVLVVALVYDYRKGALEWD